MSEKSRPLAPQSMPSVGASSSMTQDAANVVVPAVQEGIKIHSSSEDPPMPLIPPNPQLDWNRFTDPRPYVTVSGIAIDSSGSMILIHRNNNVRSAKNCWSLPSGLHEVGLTMAEQFGTELQEELGLVPIINKSVHIGSYENIRPDGPQVPGWHWVIHVLAMRVENAHTFINREPDKHDEIALVHIRHDWITGRVWAPRLGEYLHHNRKHIQIAAQSIL